jgi:hypothetical protein
MKRQRLSRLSHAKRFTINRQLKARVEAELVLVTVSSARQFFLCVEIMARFDSALFILALMRLRIRTLTPFPVRKTPSMS